MAHHQQDNFLKEQLYIKGLVVGRNQGDKRRQVMNGCESYMNPCAK
jgi:hypothetical protein